MDRSSKEAFNLAAEVERHRRENEIMTKLQNEDAREQARAALRQLEEDKATERKKSEERVKSINKGVDPYRLNDAFHQDVNRRLREEYEQRPHVLKRLETAYQGMLGALAAKQITLPPDALKPKAQLTYNPDPAKAPKAARFMTRFARAVSNVSPIARMMAFDRSAKGPQIDRKASGQTQAIKPRRDFTPLLATTAAPVRTIPAIITVAPNIAVIAPGLAVTPSPVMEAEPAVKQAQVENVKPDVQVRDQPSPGDLYNQPAAVELSDQGVEPVRLEADLKSPADLYNEAPEPRGTVEHHQHEFDYEFQ